MTEFETIMSNGIETEVPKRTSENTNITPRDLKSFNVTKDYIKSLIPDNIRNTWTFERVADIIYAAISDTTTEGTKINNYYNDVEYFNTDITKLTTEMKLAKFHDMGFSYLTVYQDDESLNNLGVFLNLIKVLKGDIRGFELILQLLGLDCEISLWTENKDLEIFTILLLFKTSSETLTLHRGTSDIELEGQKYFSWSGNELTYYTKNSVIPNYEINTNILKTFGDTYPVYNSLTADMGGFSKNGYIYTSFSPKYKELNIRFTTSEDILTEQELVRCLGVDGSIITSITSDEGLIGSYQLYPNTNYYLDILFDNDIYKFSIRTEDELTYTNIIQIESEDYIFSIDLFRDFKGSCNLAMSSILDKEDTLIYLAKNITETYVVDKPHSNKGDTIYIHEDGTMIPVGVALECEDTNNVTTSILISLATSNNNVDNKKLSKLQNLARCYLAPLVNIETSIVQDITISNTYFSAGLLNNRKYAKAEFTAIL